MTTPAQLERLGEHLRKLRLLKSGERLEALLQHAASQELPYADFLEQVLGEEVAAKTTKNIAMRTAMARFPFVKPLETFDFAYQPSVDRKQVTELASCHFIEHGDNVIVLGPPGRRQDAPGGLPGPEGHRGRLPGAVHQRRAPHRHADQGARRWATG
jgi:DNA replication protein DnaC